MLRIEESTYKVQARNVANEPHSLIAPSIEVAITSEKNQHDYLSKHLYEQTEDTANEYAEDISVKMLASTMGNQCDPKIAWDELKQLLTTGLVIKTVNITQSVTGEKNRLWTTTIVTTVFVSSKKEELSR